MQILLITGTLHIGLEKKEISSFDKIIFQKLSTNTIFEYEFYIQSTGPKMSNEETYAVQ